MRDELMCDRPTTLPITFEGVEFAAGGRSIVSGVSFSIEAGPPTLLVGPNGAGKTTLIKLAMGLLTPSAGRILPAKPAACPRSAIVFQKPVMLRRSVLSNVMFALTAAGREADAKTAFGWLDVWGWAPSQIVQHGAYPGVSSSAWHSPARSPATRRCSFWTNRPRASIRRLPRPWRTSSVPQRLGASKSSWRLTIWVKPDASQATLFFWLQA
jgi:ABC-type sugar transport system ATPase subunit